MSVEAHGNLRSNAHQSETSLTESTINNEPRFRDLEIIHDSLTQQITNTKETLYKNEATQTENIQNYLVHCCTVRHEI